MYPIGETVFTLIRFERFTCCKQLELGMCWSYSYRDEYTVGQNQRKMVILSNRRNQSSSLCDSSMDELCYIPRCSVLYNYF